MERGYLSFSFGEGAGNVNKGIRIRKRKEF
jgi:hypothetical protein